MGWNDDVIETFRSAEKPVGSPATATSSLGDRWELPAKILPTASVGAAVAHTEGMWWRFLKAVKERQHRVAPTTWVAAIAAAVYTFAPIDLIPELVLGPLGFVDDIGLWGILAVLLAREQRRWLTSLEANQPRARAAAVSSR